MKRQLSSAQLKDGDQIDGFANMLHVNKSRKAIEMAKTDGRLFATVGCHPTRCGEFESHEEGPDGYLNSLSKLVEENREKVVALGEMGLDYDRTQGRFEYLRQIFTNEFLMDKIMSNDCSDILICLIISAKL